MRKMARSYHELRHSEWASCVCKRAIHLKSTKLSPSDAFMTSEQKRMSILMFFHSSKIGYLPRPLPMPTGYNVPRRSNQSLKSVPIWGERSSSHRWKKEGHEHAWEHSDSVDSVTVERYHELQFVLFLQQQLLARSCWGNNVDILLKTSQCLEQMHS